MTFPSQIMGWRNRKQRAKGRLGENERAQIKLCKLARGVEAKDTKQGLCVCVCNNNNNNYYY